MRNLVSGISAQKKSQPTEPFRLARRVRTDAYVGEEPYGTVDRRETRYSNNWVSWPGKFTFVDVETAWAMRIPFDSGELPCQAPIQSMGDC